MSKALLLGSAPYAINAAKWRKSDFDALVAINNAYAIRPDWDYMVHPWDFPQERLPVASVGQTIVTEQDFVPAQNLFGGFVYAGATMAFTAGYWALSALAPTTMAFYGCDMHYAPSGNTHFYGTGTADPLRADITLQSLEAKSARLMLIAAAQGCATVNLSVGPSRLLMPVAMRSGLPATRPQPYCEDKMQRALARENELGYYVPSGRYWEELERFDRRALAELDQLWLQAAEPMLRKSA
jgi:hypothetical protein